MIGLRRGSESPSYDTIEARVQTLQNSYGPSQLTPITPPNQRNPIQRIIALRRKLHKPRAHEREHQYRRVPIRRVRHRPRQITARTNRGARERVDDLAAERDGQSADGLRAGLLDVVVVLQGVCLGWDEVGQGLGDGGRGGGAAVEDARARERGLLVWGFSWMWGWEGGRV